MLQGGRRGPGAPTQLAGPASKSACPAQAPASSRGPRPEAPRTPPHKQPCRRVPVNSLLFHGGSSQPPSSQPPVPMAPCPSTGAGAGTLPLSPCLLPCQDSALRGRLRVLADASTPGSSVPGFGPTSPASSPSCTARILTASPSAREEGRSQRGDVPRSEPSSPPQRALLPAPPVAHNRQKSPLSAAEKGWAEQGPGGVGTVLQTTAAPRSPRAAQLGEPQAFTSDRAPATPSDQRAGPPGAPFPAPRDLVIFWTKCFSALRLWGKRGVPTMIPAGFPVHFEGRFPLVPSAALQAYPLDSAIHISGPLRPGQS